MMGMGLWAGLDSSQQSDRIYGMVVALVTNTKDEAGCGRIKVKFPWLSDQDESCWARVLAPMAGNGFGVYFLPSVGDEVLVGFEHGMIEFPYILGSLWSQKSKPPEPNNDGKNNRCMIQSRSGHVIIFDDTEDSEIITIRDKSKNNKIVIDTAKKTITLTAEENLTLEAKGTLSLKSDGDIKINGRNLKLESQQNFEVKANANCKLEASTGMALKSMAGVKINDGALEVT